MKKVIIAATVGIVLIACIIVCGQMFTINFVNVEFVNGARTTTEQKILLLADIDTNTNIFVLNESALKKRIEDGYPDNSVKVTDVVREFPNKVTIKVTERVALYKIKASAGNIDGYVRTDRNFQRNVIYTYDEVKDDVLINVTGIELKDSFQTEECYALKNIANAFINCGIKEEALPYFIQEISFSDEKIFINLRTSDTKFAIDKTQNDDLNTAISSIYKKYVNLTPDCRNGITIFP